MDDFNNQVVRAQANSGIYNFAELSFEPDDIKYIIVASQEEILPMISAIRQINGKYDENKINVLISKIISTQQIEEDF